MKDSTLSLEFPAISGHEVVACFDGGDITSDAGMVLLDAADRKIGLTSALAKVVRDERRQKQVDHPMQVMMKERIIAIASGYEDANDLDTLRFDPVLKTACGRLPESGKELASQPTISRFENALGEKDLIRMARILAEKVISQIPKDSKQVIIDVDATDDPCHGQQQLQFFNSFYDKNCYIPLLFFIMADDGPQRLACSLLRPGNAGIIKGLGSTLRGIVQFIRKRLPKVRIILRADSGFGVAKVIALCHRLGIDFLLGLPSNEIVQRLSIPIQMDAAIKYGWEGDGCKEFGEFRYGAKTWERKERVIVKAEITRKELNPRFIVTNMEDFETEEMYNWYCKRGDAENRIKEFKIGLSSGRTSCHMFLANQTRLLLHMAASLLMSILQVALTGSKWADAQVNTIRMRLLKVGARVVETCRKVWLHLPTAFPNRDIWKLLHEQLC